jgi:hypothetical protein
MSVKQQRYRRSPKGQATKSRYQTKERQLHPERHAARMRVSRAVAKGDLIRPEHCEHCGATAAESASGWIEAAHDNYGCPLDVEWLCHRCHEIKDRG